MEDARKKAKAEFDIRVETEKALGHAVKEKNDLAEKLVNERKERRSAKVGLKTTEAQAEGQCKLLHQKEEELSIAQHEILDLKKELAEAKETAWTIQEIVEATSKASFN